VLWFCRRSFQCNCLCYTVYILCCFFSLQITTDQCKLSSLCLELCCRWTPHSLGSALILALTVRHLCSLRFVAITPISLTHCVSCCNGLSDSWEAVQSVFSCSRIDVLLLTVACCYVCCKYYTLCWHTDATVIPAVTLSDTFWVSSKHLCIFGLYGAM